MDKDIQNKIIDIDYFIANQSEIENIKNKKISSAISTLLKFQSGNYLVYDENIQKITNITQSTAVFFVQSLAKDIGKSYERFEEACSIVYNSDFKDILSSEPVLFGKKAVFVSHDSGFTIVDPEKEDFFKEMPLLFFEDQDKFKRFDLWKLAGSLHKDSDNYKFETYFSSFSARNKRLGEVGLFSDKADSIVAVRKGEDEKTIFLKHAFSYGKKSTRYAKDGSKTRLDFSFKLDYLEESTHSLTGLDLDLFSKFIKKTEMFTYGYLINSDEYLSRKTQKYKYYFVNPEYDENTKLGRDAVDNINKDYQTVLELLQYAVDTDMRFSKLYERVTELSFSSVFFQKFIQPKFVEIAPKVVSDKTTIKEEVVKINAFLNKAVENLNSVDTIDNNEFKHDYELSKEIKNIAYFSSAKKVIDKSMEIFNSIQSNATIEYDSDLDIEKVNKIIKSFTVRTRAGVLDTKVDSYVLNMRGGIFKMNESLQKIYDEDSVIKTAIDTLKNNKYYDYFEFDRDYIDEKTSSESMSINRAKLLEFARTINNLNMPVDKKGAFKIRKLGNYKATGIYFSGVNTIAVDCRFGNHFSSVKHEEVHRIDISSHLNKYGRQQLVNYLEHYFSSRLSDLDNAHYYLKDVELIARAGEIASLLYEGNYEKHLSQYKQGSISENDLWENVKFDFENSKTKLLMKSFQSYSEDSVYIDFQKATQKGSNEEKLINTILEYYKPFFSKDITNVQNLQSSYSFGNEDRTIEGIKTANFKLIHISSKEEKLLAPKKIILKNFNIFNVNFDTIGTKKSIDIFSYFEDNKTTEPTVLKEQLECKAVSIEKLFLDKNVFYNILSDTNLKSILISHTDNPVTINGFFEKTVFHFLKEDAEKSLDLIRNNLSLTSKINNNITTKLLEEKSNINKELFFVELAKSVDSFYFLEKMMYEVDSKSSYYSEIFTNGIVSIIDNDDGWVDDKLFLTKAIDNDVEFSKEDINRIKSLSLDFDKFYHMFLVNNYTQNFDIAKFSHKLEKFLDSVGIKYSRNDFIKKVYIGWKVNSNELIPINKEDAKNYVSNSVETMLDYRSFLKNITLEGSTNSELYKLTSSIIPDSFTKNLSSANINRLVNTLVVNNSYKDFKSILDWDSDSKFHRSVFKGNGTHLYSAIFTNPYKDDSYKNYIKFLDDEKTEDVQCYSDYKFYSFFKEKKYDMCANMINSSAITKENLYTMAGVTIALDYELGTDSFGILESFLSESDYKNIYIAKNIKDRLISRGKSNVPIEIVKNVLNLPAKEIRKLDGSFGSGFSSMAIFAKDVNELDLESYANKIPQTLNYFLNYETSVPFLLSNQDIFKITDRDGFCMSFQNPDEVHDVKSRVNFEINKFKCISQKGLTRLTKYIFNVIEKASVVANPPTIERLSQENLDIILKEHIPSDKHLIQMSMLHGIINGIEQNYPNEANLVKHLKELSDKISYHSIYAKETNDENVAKYHFEKFTKGMETVDGIVFKEQFKNFTIAMSPETYSDLALLAKHLDKISPNIETTDIQKSGIDEVENISPKENFNNHEEYNIFCSPQ